MVYGVSGYSYTNLNGYDNVLLSTYEEAINYISSSLETVYHKVTITFVTDEKKERYSIYYYNNGWVNLQKVKFKLKKYFEKGE